MSQKLFIPHIGTILVLAEDWSFRVYFEKRNQKLLEVFGVKARRYSSYGYTELTEADFVDGKIPDNLEYEPAMTKDELESAYKSYNQTRSYDKPYLNVTLLKGTQLKIERVFIRVGAEAFDSLTFRTTKVGPDKAFFNKRFWVKLRDANNIICDVIG